MRTTTVFACVILAAVSTSAETDPLRCWWQTSQGAVTIGETFTATLTCAVREQESTRTVPDESRLAAAVVQLAPFEVLSGTHPADLRSPTHRFLQYSYTVRIVDRDVIGQDAKFPDLRIAYRVHALTHGEWIEGRDRTYTIPGQSVRVLSLVPRDAADIRDSSNATFANVAALRFRARAFDIAGYALLALGVLVAIPAVVRLSRQRRVANPEEHVIPPRSILRTAGDSLAEVARESARTGWTVDLVARGLTALRLAAAGGLGRDVASRPVVGPESPSGLTLSRGLLKKQRSEISSAVTAADVTAALSDPTTSYGAIRRDALEDIARALHAFTTALYRETFQADAPLDAALSAARTAVQRLARR
jgi:hypothetical protein